MMQSQQIPMTFQRYETKYMLSPIMARKLRKSLPGHLQMDEYGLDTICSLYYDTPDFQLIRASLDKPGSPAHTPFAGKTRLQRKTATPQLWSGQRDQPHIRRTKEKI